MATIVIFLIVGGFMFLFEVQNIIVLGNRVEDSVIAAGWAGFSEIDLEAMATRRNISDIETRNIYLDKEKARDKVIEYLKKNLKLDNSLYTLPESYIVHKDNPVIIDEITVYNPDELPATLSTGSQVNQTTIHIRVRIPVETSFTGLLYAEKSVPVNTDSFLLESQK
jgi:hypothetical protein